MAPDVIRSGRLPAPDDGGIFQGDRFLVSTQIPTFGHWKEFIIANGGAVVSRENDANIKIGDQAKPKTFGGKDFVSWKFLEDCERESRLVDKNDPKYAIELRGANSTGSKRQSIGNASAKAGSPDTKRARNFFTEHDDLILFKRLVKQRMNLSGNAVYKDLEKEFPRHSFHGWRGRWLDIYAKQNSDPQHWLDLFQSKLGDVQAKEKSVDDVDEAQPPRKKPKFTTPARRAVVTLQKSSPATKTDTSTKTTPKYNSAANVNASNTGRTSMEPKQAEHRHLSVTTSNPSKAVASSSRKVSTSSSKQAAIRSATTSGAQGSFTTGDDNLLRTLKTALQYAPQDKHGEIWEEFQDVNSQHSMRKWKQRYEEIFNGISSKVPPAYERAPEQPLDENQRSPPSPTSDTRSDAPKLQSQHDRKISPLRKRIVSSPTYQPDDVATDPEDNNRQITICSTSRSKPAPPTKPPITPPNKDPKSLKRKRGFYDEIPSTPDERLRVTREVSEELGTLPPASSPPPRLLQEPLDSATVDNPSLEALEAGKQDTFNDTGDLKDLSIPEITLPNNEKPSSPPVDSYDPDNLIHPRNYREAEKWMNDLYLHQNVPWHRIMYAMRCTMSSRRLSEQVLDCLKKGKKFPSDEGIWTKEEDGILLGDDSKKIERLAKRKGQEEINRRLTWLQDPENEDDGSFEEEEEKYRATGMKETERNEHQ